MFPEKPIAVVSMAGIFPGAPDLETYWNNIVKKKVLARPVPHHRWAAERDFMVSSGSSTPDRAYSDKACLVDSIPFDPDITGLETDLRENLDPMHQMVLTAGHKAFSSCNFRSLDNNRTGVILAAIALPTDMSSKMTQDLVDRVMTKQLFPHFPPADSPHPGNMHAFRGGARVTGLPAAILSMSLGLGGGSCTLDAACASSLYAIRLACMELLNGRKDTMLAGGVSRPDALFTQVGFSQLQAMSPSGICRPFDRNADGLVVGEGVGIVVLKRLEDAVRHGDTVWGVIRGIGMANDITGNLLAPDSEGQLRAMRQAYAQSGWRPTQVDHIECHGAGTPVGDTTELKSLAALWQDADRKKHTCPIGSVKSMIGHTLTAAGAAGLIKTLLAMHHGILPPTAGFSSPPDNSPLTDGPFRVQTKASAWEISSGSTRKAAVSAFGFGGINAHLLVEEYRPRPEKRSINHSFAESSRKKTRLPQPVAVIGMGIHTGNLNSLEEFRTAVFHGDVNTPTPSSNPYTFDGETGSPTPLYAHWGAFIPELSIQPGCWRIPPNEIGDILPQHLLMLQVAAAALQDAAVDTRKKNPASGAVVGMDFDFNATNFELRWIFPRLVRKWIQKGLLPPETATEEWTAAVMDALSAPLTYTRTLGALGGIIASRLAREFRFGGPSFTVSCEESSGLKAIDIAVQFLREGIADIMVAGAVDFAGDARAMLLRNAVRPFSPGKAMFPHEQAAQGPLPGDGACAVVLKRLDTALENKDRIYAVIPATGQASSGKPRLGPPGKETVSRVIRETLSTAAVPADRIGYVETHGSADPTEDRIEGAGLVAALPPSDSSCALGSAAPLCGWTGAAAGLMAFVKTSLCLFYRAIPVFPGFEQPSWNGWEPSRFHFPAFSQYWPRNRVDGPRTAVTFSMTTDGNAFCVVSHELDAAKHIEIKERNRSLIPSPVSLFVVNAASQEILIQRLNELRTFTADFPMDQPLGDRAAAWFQRHPYDPSLSCTISILADRRDRLQDYLQKAVEAVDQKHPRRMGATGGACYAPGAETAHAKTAFLYPGSGNHYLGMGRDIALRWPSVLQSMDADTERLYCQMLPDLFIPRRVSWTPGWERKARKAIGADTRHMIFGQVLFGDLMTRVMSLFQVRPQAVIGYSLGETAGYFATSAWPDKGIMLDRMENTDLFSTELAGSCRSLRKAWKLAPDEPFQWCAALVNRPASRVRKAVAREPHSRLLIVNTPGECVIGGSRAAVSAVARRLNAEILYLDGVVSVHCDAAQPVAEAYRSLHLFQNVRHPEGIDYYSCATGKTTRVTADTSADSIQQQALKGFDFSRTIEQAYADGIRCFVEMGPHNSTARMVAKILGDRPHLAISASTIGENDIYSVYRCLATLAAHRIPCRLDALYETAADRPQRATTDNTTVSPPVTIPTGSRKRMQLPGMRTAVGNTAAKPAASARPHLFRPTNAVGDPAPSTPGSETSEDISGFGPFGDIVRAASATAEAHETFLNFSRELSRNYAHTLLLQDKLIKNTDGREPVPVAEAPATVSPATESSTRNKPPPLFTREMCMEFAVGSVARVLGPEFQVIDTYKARVRLPDEPLMLVDRILSIEGEKCSLGSGKLVTEHDVLPGAWYLDGGKAPVCIAVEAGQADLFLSSYLGIDHVVQGKRTYRLLDAKVVFHRGLPLVGETIRYVIHIEKFIRHGETHMFFFHFSGTIDGNPLITMTDGCAGFFTEEEVRNSGGIILSEKDKLPQSGTCPEDWRIAAPDLGADENLSESYTEKQVDTLRAGELSSCFGTVFSGIRLARALWLPDGRMKLIDRILALEPRGGRYRLGSIRAEADIHPDDWFLTCHFVDDMVMPGTLMYECCAHTLRFFLLRIGWVTENPLVCCEPVAGVQSVLKCRGPVTPATRQVVYQVDIREIGYNPEPYVIADAHMFADGHRIVQFTDMGMKLSGIHRKDIETLWSSRQKASSPLPAPVHTKTVFDRDQLLEFGSGSPSKAFGRPYRPFDHDRFIARLPRPPYLCMDRVVSAKPPPWELSPDGWIEAQYTIPPDAWYFSADRATSLPVCILMECALQPCGWLAAYMGSALKSDKDLHFRNLDGAAVLHREITQKSGMLTIRARLSNVSAAGDMIIQQYDFEILCAKKRYYSGNTAFGFFTKNALEQQDGLKDARGRAFADTGTAAGEMANISLEKVHPQHPADETPPPSSGLFLPAGALQMVDTIECCLPRGGAVGLGYIRGSKSVDADEWFFRAHFYQDPVCPGSLGVDSFIQLLKFFARQRWPQCRHTHRFRLLAGKEHAWRYRGQILPHNHLVKVEATITGLEEPPNPVIMADGFLQVDGLLIYEMKNFGLELVPDKKSGN